MVIMTFRPREAASGFKSRAGGTIGAIVTLIIDRDESKLLLT